MFAFFFISKTIYFIELSLYMGYINAANKHVFLEKLHSFFFIFTTLALLQGPVRAPDKS